MKEFTIYLDTGTVVTVNADYMYYTDYPANMAFCNKRKEDVIAEFNSAHVAGYTYKDLGEECKQSEDTVGKVDKTKEFPCTAKGCDYMTRATCNGCPEYNEWRKQYKLDRK